MITIAQIRAAREADEAAAIKEAESMPYGDRSCPFYAMGKMVVDYRDNETYGPYKDHMQAVRVALAANGRREPEQ